MFFLLIWWPIGLLVMTGVFVFYRSEFPVHDLDDFLGNAVIFAMCAALWPVVVVGLILTGIYTLIFER